MFKKGRLKRFLIFIINEFILATVSELTYNLIDC